MSELLGFDFEEHWRSYESRGIPYDPAHEQDIAMLERILELLVQHHQRATFFVVGMFAQKEPSIISRIVEAKQEIACHTYSHRALHLLTPEEFRDDAYRGKSILEELSGHRVQGYRAAQWSLTESTAWALPILCDLGYTYDSSAFPGRFHRYGWPGMIAKAHRLKLEGGRSIIEFPAARLGIGGWAIQVRGGFHWRAFPDFFNRLSQKGGPWYFHPYDLSGDYPLPKALPVKVRLLKRLGTGSSLQRFTRLLNKHRFCSHSDVLAGIT